MAATQGDKDATELLGRYYFAHGRSVDDHAKAHQYLASAVEQGVDEAKALLGVMYYDGRGVEQDRTRAAELILSTESPESAVRTTLGMMYYYGHGVDQDAKKAFEYLLPVAKEDNVSALLLCAGMYLSGEGVDKNPYQAEELYRRAVEHGSVDGQRELGKMYYNGTGAKFDRETGLQYLRVAARKGDAEAEKLAAAHDGRLASAQRMKEREETARREREQENREADQANRQRLNELAKEEANKKKILETIRINKEKDDARAEINKLRNSYQSKKREFNEMSTRPLNPGEKRQYSELGGELTAIESKLNTLLD